jgi:hypothetical protein
MIAPDHATKRFETILRERGHPYMASGRDGSPDRRQAILALAGGRSALSEASISELAGGDCGLNNSRALRLSFGRSQVYVTTPRKQQTEADDIVLLYRDESEALTHPCLARAWAKSGTD